MQIPASKNSAPIMQRSSKVSFVGSTNLFGCTPENSSSVNCPILLSESMFGLFLLATIYFAEMKRLWADKLTIVYWACRSTYNCEESSVHAEPFGSIPGVAAAGPRL